MTRWRSEAHDWGRARDPVRLGRVRRRLLAAGGFWRRVTAALLDGIAVESVTGVFAFVVGVFILLLSPAPLEQTSAVLPTPVALPAGIVIGWLYFALLESSRRQATLGKRVMGIAVIDTEGERLSFARATGRHFARFLSLTILFLGFVGRLHAAQQALHDLLASTWSYDCLTDPGGPLQVDARTEGGARGQAHRSRARRGGYDPNQMLWIVRIAAWLATTKRRA